MNKIQMNENINKILNGLEQLHKLAKPFSTSQTPKDMCDPLSYKSTGWDFKPPSQLRDKLSNVRYVALHCSIMAKSVNYAGLKRNTALQYLQYHKHPWQDTPYMYTQSSLKCIDSAFGIDDIYDFEMDDHITRSGTARIRFSSPTNWNTMKVSVFFHRHPEECGKFILCLMDESWNHAC